MENIERDNFTTSDRFFLWLAQFANLERGAVPRSFNLDRMRLLCDLAGNPEKCAPSVHIAGSKGKGSVTAMTTSMLAAAGLKVARYMSPHVSDIRERVCLGGEFFDEAVYLKAALEVRAAVDGAKGPLFDPSEEGGGKPSFFELFTLFYFICARVSKCDIMVIETGMGGRLDCTNVVDPLVSVISLIELEHVKFLGDTISAIAGEKAGIIKSGKPVIVAKQGKEALEVFVKTAKEKNSPLTYCPDAVKIEGLNVTEGGTAFVLSFANGKFANGNFAAGTALKLSLPVPGAVQAENAALSILALKTAFPDIKDSCLKEGLEKVALPARFELISKDPAVVIDGAHTPQSAALCADTFCSIYGEGNVLIFGCAEDKNVEGMAGILLPRFSSAVITTPGKFKASDPAKIFAVFRDLAQKLAAPAKVGFVKEPTEAFETALSQAKSANKAVLCVGSFYLAAEIRAAGKTPCAPAV